MQLSLILSLTVISSFLYGCDYFFQDPRLILYRPSSIKIEDSSGTTFSKLPVPLSSPGGDQLKTIEPFDSLWGKDPKQFELTDLFNSQEVPYLGGDNCLNSIFFDLIGIPLDREGNSAYQSRDFYLNLQGFVKEPTNYFFYNNHLFLKESTFPYINKSKQTVVGTREMKGGANQALDQYYQDQIKNYQAMFDGRIKTYKISCEYPPQTVGRVREELVLNMMESNDSIIFLADKYFHMVIRKDDSIRYVSDFSFSKAFFREQLHFKPN